MQTGKNIKLGYKVEATFNTPPGASGATQMRVVPSGGAKYSRQAIVSQEVRSDGLTSMGRLGMHAVQLGYGQELSLGTQNDWLEAIMRGTWAAAAAITQATAGLTSMRTPSTSTIEASAGSWITAGVRVGDIIRITGFATAANNSINLRVTAVTALIITVAGTPLTIDNSFDTTFTVTVQKKLINPATPVRRSFYIDEYYQDTSMDLSQVIGGVRVSSLKLSLKPNGIITVDWGLVGASMAALATGSSPYYSSPTPTTSIPLTSIEAVIRSGGADIATLSAFDLNLDLGAKPQEVIGSTTTPDIFDNSLAVSGTISGIVADLANVTRIGSETELELAILATEPEAEPKDFVSIFVPRFKLSDHGKNLGADGAMIETVSWFAGKKESTAGYDDTMLHFASSV